MPARFSPGSGRSQGVSVKARLETWPSHWPLCWWFIGDQLLKAGGRGGCFVLTPLLSKTVLLGALLSQLLNTVGGCCGDMAPCWNSRYHGHAWPANLLARAFWPPGLSLSLLRASFCEFGQTYYKAKTRSCELVPPNKILILHQAKAAREHTSRTKRNK